MQTELAELAGAGRGLPEAGGVWLTITELAGKLNVRKSTVSEKVAKLEAQGLVRTKPAPKGRGKLVDLASYRQATNATGDAARELAAQTRSAANDDAAEPPRDPAYRDAQTRAKNLDAEIKELDLAERRREVVSVAELGAACNEVIGVLAAAINRLPQRADDMAAEVGRDGVTGARRQYKRDVRDVLALAAAEFERLLQISPVAASAAGALSEDARLWGDLDPGTRDA